MSDTDDEDGFDLSRIFDSDDDGETHPDYFSDLDDLDKDELIRTDGEE